MKVEGTIQKTVRFNLMLWGRIAKYAEGVELDSENELIIHIIKAGIESLEEQQIDDHIETRQEVPRISAPNIPDCLTKDNEPEKPNPDIEPPEYDQVSEGYKASKGLPELEEEEDFKF